jgi:hypothetical protein
MNKPIFQDLTPVFRCLLSGSIFGVPSLLTTGTKTIRVYQGRY